VGSLQEWGYAAIEALQSLRSPFLDALCRALSALGYEPFYVVFLPLLYWLGEKRLASRVFLLVLLSMYVNGWAKLLLAQPRPAAARVAVLDTPRSGGLPSGHAQNAVACWGLIAVLRRRRALRVGLAALVLAIGLSRLYLGVHFPHDLVAGWAIGGALLAGFVGLWPRLAARLERLPWPLQAALAAALPLLLLLGYHSLSVVKAMSTLAGFGAGVAYERARVRFAAGGAAWRRGLRALLGLAVAVALLRGLGTAPGGAVGVGAVYLLAGLWIGGAAPWLFVRLGLAAREPASPRS